MLCQHIYDRREAGGEGKQGVAKVQVQQSASPQTGEHSSHDFCPLQESSVSESEAYAMCGRALVEKDYWSSSGMTRHLWTQAPVTLRSQ